MWVLKFFTQFHCQNDESPTSINWRSKSPNFSRKTEASSVSRHAEVPFVGRTDGRTDVHLDVNKSGPIFKTQPSKPRKTSRRLNLRKRFSTAVIRKGCPTGGNSAYLQRGPKVILQIRSSGAYLEREELELNFDGIIMALEF